MLETATRAERSLGSAVLLLLLPLILILPSEQRIVISEYLDYLLGSSRPDKLCDSQIESFYSFVSHGHRIPYF